MYRITGRDCVVLSYTSHKERKPHQGSFSFLRYDHQILKPPPLYHVTTGNPNGTTHHVLLLLLLVEAVVPLPPQIRHLLFVAQLAF